MSGLKTTALGLFIQLSVLLSGCATTEPVLVSPHVNPSPEEVTLRGAAPRAGVSIGLEAESNESDSLEDLEVLPGVRVASVDQQGPAAAADLKVGDVVLSAGGVTTNDPDALAAVLVDATEDTPLELVVRRDTVAFRAQVYPQRISRTGVPPRELYRVDPVRTRAGYRTTVVTLDGQSRVVTTVVRLFPGSPLPDAGVRPGDHILSLEGQTLDSAQDLVTRLLEEQAAGDRVRLEIVRDQVCDYDVSLWEPPRRLARLMALPLFRYETTLEPSRTQFKLIDLWLFSLFAYEREGGEREYRFLSLFRFGTGQGELVETPVSDVSSDPSTVGERVP